MIQSFMSREPFQSLFLVVFGITCYFFSGFIDAAHQQTMAKIVPAQLEVVQNNWRMQNEDGTTGGAAPKRKAYQPTYETQFEGATISYRPNYWNTLDNYTVGEIVPGFIDPETRTIIPYNEIKGGGLAPMLLFFGGILAVVFGACRLLLWLVRGRKAELV